MKIYFKKPQSIPFSKWCEDNNLSLDIQGKETFRYLVSFHNELYYQTVDKDIMMRAGGNSIHQALIELMKVLNANRDLLTCDDGRYVNVPREGLYLDFDDINTQEVVNV